MLLAEINAKKTNCTGNLMMQTRLYSSDACSNVLMLDFHVTI
jgi:prepilin-type processing-associated H-X9-DG protein